MRSLVFLAFVLLVLPLAAADQKKAAQKLREAERAYAAGNLARAEKSARDAIKEDPGSLHAHALLGDVLMATRRYSAAAEAYTAALKFEERQPSLTRDQRRSLLNQQGAAYGMGGRLDRAQEIFQQAIRDDPDYPLFHYNLGAVYAEKGQLEPALDLLREAWKRRANLPEGQSFPDPRIGPSFAAYLQDQRFQEAVREMVF
jgi:tetratricopeptide (TPR) repeat protein